MLLYILGTLCVMYECTVFRWANPVIAKKLRYGQEHITGHLHSDVVDGRLFKDFQDELGRHNYACGCL